MGFLTKLDQGDGTFAWCGRRRKGWICSGVTLLMIGLAGWGVWRMFWASQAGSDCVALIVHNEIARPILAVSIDGMTGEHTEAFHPNNKHGSENDNTRCWDHLTGDTAEIAWTVEGANPMSESGISLEQRRELIPLPERKQGENDLHIHFLPGHEVLLGWSDNAFSPYDPRSPNYPPVPSLTDN